MPEEERDAYASLNFKSESFLSNPYNSYYFLRVHKSGRDFLSVVDDAKRELIPIIDMLHIGFPDRKFELHNHCLVIGLDHPQRANIQPISLVTDGNFKSHQDLYDLLLEKVNRISGNKNIEPESYRKMVSAFRHLRLGTEADEPEQQFINYWIGLEYIFSNYDIADSTIVRLKEFFTMAHANAYLRRNMLEFCQDIHRLKLESSIPGFNIDLQFLKDSKSCEYIITNYITSHPLLSYRAYLLKKLIDGTSAKELINRHKNNLEWHLTRCYRVRNEIVHEAAIHLDIKSITANLRYYLVFILTDLVQFLVNSPKDINLSGFASIEDYFILQEIKFRSYASTGFNFGELVNETSATEIFM